MSTFVLGYAQLKNRLRTNIHVFQKKKVPVSTGTVYGWKNGWKDTLKDTQSHERHTKPFSERWKIRRYARAQTLTWQRHSSQTPYAINSVYVLYSMRRVYTLFHARRNPIRVSRYEIYRAFNSWAALGRLLKYYLQLHFVNTFTFTKKAILLFSTPCGTSLRRNGRQLIRLQSQLCVKAGKTRWETKRAE